MKSLKNLNYSKLAIIIIIIGIIIRFYLASVYHVAGDACWQLSNSRFIAENFRIPLLENFGRDEPFWAPPLFHIVSAIVYALFGIFNEKATEFAVKMVSPVFGSLALILAFLIAKKMYNSRIAFYSTIFLAFIPLSLDYSVFSYIDGMLSFLVLLSVYFALEDRIFSSAIALGLAILTKYNGIFALPVLMYVLYSKNKKNILRKYVILILISMAIGSVWFIRNWVYLGNPIWPFMNNIFNGYQSKSFVDSGVGSIDLLRIFSVNAIAPLYLGFFGVPDGNIRTLSFFPIPYLGILLALWLIATAVFLIPFVIGIVSKNLKHKILLIAWIVSFLLVVLLYVFNANQSAARFMLPALPAIAIVWAYGIERIRHRSVFKPFAVIMLLIMAGFILTSFVKITFAAKEWSVYNSDFEWVKASTDKNAIVMTGSQCVSYNINRQTLRPLAENLEKSDYVFVNQDFRLDKRNIVDEKVLLQIKSRGRLDYSNEKTKSEIYKLAPENNSK